MKKINDKAVMCETCGLIHNEGLGEVLQCPICGKDICRGLSYDGCMGNKSPKQIVVGEEIRLTCTGCYRHIRVIFKEELTSVLSKYYPKLVVDEVLNHVLSVYLFKKPAGGNKNEALLEIMEDYLEEKQNKDNTEG